MEPIEMIQVVEVRVGLGPRDPKLMSELERHSGTGPVDIRCVTVVAGCDMANPSLYNFVATDSDTAKVSWVLTNFFFVSQFE